jgi:predicted DsbA family dithiol-disulfide isomerase
MRVVEVFAEMACPFTHVGLRRLVDARAERGTDAPLLHVRGWPLELVNGAPLAAEVVAEEVDALRAQVAPDLFGGFDPRSLPRSSLEAMNLAAGAYAVDLPVGEAVSLELRWRLFERGHDIADLSVLREVARGHGLPPTLVDGHDLALQDYAEGQRRGVVGSPHFFTPDADYFCPTLDIERVDGVLHIRPDIEAFSAFLTDVLGTAR